MPGIALRAPIPYIALLVALENNGGSSLLSSLRHFLRSDFGFISAAANRYLAKVCLGPAVTMVHGCEAEA